MEKINAFKVNGKLYEIAAEAEEAQAFEDLKLIVEDFYYSGIDELGIVESLLEYKYSLKEIFNKL